MIQRWKELATGAKANSAVMRRMKNGTRRRAASEKNFATKWKA
jgi:hypothetical protein